MQAVAYRRIRVTRVQTSTAAGRLSFYLPFPLSDSLYPAAIQNLSPRPLSRGNPIICVLRFVPSNSVCLITSPILPMLSILSGYAAWSITGCFEAPTRRLGAFAASVYVDVGQLPRDWRAAD